MKILVVDDDQDIRYLLVKVFHAYGHETTAAANGVEALEQALTQPPDIILSDIMMPKMDGYQLCHECKQNEQLKNIPFVFYTAAYTSDEDERFALSLGATFIRKPAEPDVLVQKLCDVFEKAKSGAVAPAKVAPIKQFLFLTEYNKRIVAKLEEKVAELEVEITERKKAEEALLRSQASLAEAQKIAHLGNWDWDIKNNRLSWSDEIYRIFGLEPQQFSATYEAFLNSVYPDDRALVQKSVDEALYGGKPYSIEHRIVLPDGSVRIVHERAEATFGKNGKPIQMVGTVQDITEHKQVEEERKQAVEKLLSAMQGTIQAIALTVETRDPYTAGHQRRVTTLAISIATKMARSEELIQGISMAGIVHDIGKIYVPAEILSKPTRLSKIEFDMIKEHCQAGYDILKSVEFPWPIAQIILQHHERMDGSGYPSCLSGEDILLEARILAVADVVEAMASHRPYRPALGLDKALEEITQDKGKLYDPKVADACKKLFAEGRFKFES